MMQEVVLAALRDASWYDCPGRVCRYHIDAGRGMSACDPRMMPLITRELQPASWVPVELRCQRNGCKQRWPAATVAK
jgi:hypothetical protein